MDQSDVKRRLRKAEEDLDAARILEKDNADRIGTLTQRIEQLESDRQRHLDRIVLLDKQMALFVRLANSFFIQCAIDGERFPAKINRVEAEHWTEVEERDRKESGK